MKVLITTDWYKPAVNGVVSSVTALQSGLTALGHEVRVLTLSADMKFHAEDGVTYLGSIGAGKIYPEVRLKTEAWNFHIGELIKWRPDVVHSQCEFSTFYPAVRIAESCKCPLVHTYHTLYEDFTHYFSPNISLGKCMASAFSKFILTKAQTVIVPTEKVRELLLGYGVKTPIAVQPSGFDTEAFSRPEDGAAAAALRGSLGFCADDTVLVFVGRLAKEKNIDELLGLLAETREPKTKLLLVGDGPYRQQLEARCRELGLAEKTVFAGQIPHAEIARFPPFRSV